MADRGELGALNYQIPGAGQYTTAPQPSNPQTANMPDPVGEAMQGLQYVQGATEDYYKKWAMLKSFAHEAAQNMDIDVTRPDYAKPESIKLNQIYTKALADIKYQGDLLKNSQSMLTASQQRGDLPNQDQTQQPFSTQRNYQEFMPNELDPIVQQANMELSKPHYGDSIKQGEALYKEKYELMTSLMEKQPGMKQYWERQRNALVRPLKAEREFQPPYDRNAARDKRRIDRSGEEAKKIVHLVEGVSTGYEPSETEFTDKGTPYLVNNDMVGDQYGGGRIVKWRINPDTDKTELVVAYGSGDKESQKVLPINRGDAMSVIREVSAANQAKYGFNADDVEDYIHEHKLPWFDTKGQLRSDQILSSDSQDIKKANAAKVQDTFSKVGPKIQAMTERIKKLETHWYKKNDSDTIKLPNGTPVNIKAAKDGEEYEVLNIKELIPEDNFGSKAAADNFYKANKTMSLQDLAKFLVEQGAHLTQPTPSGSSKSNKADVL